MKNRTYAVNPSRLLAIKDAGSNFVTNQLMPFCKLVILGDYEYTENFTRKRELLALSDIEELKPVNRKNKTYLGIQQEVRIMIFDFSHYDHIIATPAYRGATMIAIFPNSSEDLRIWNNTINDPRNRPVQDCKIVYVNLFEPNSDDYQSIELMATQLNQNATEEKTYYNKTTYLIKKLDLHPATINNLVDIAIQHTIDVVERFAEDNPAELGAERTGGCRIL